jgi:sporulation protein YlmC with PRC-barrel domain
MVQVQRIEDWLGQQVVDRDGEDLGKLDEVYYDAESGAPVLISVKSGLFGRKAALVPLDGATVDRDHLQVAHTKDTIETAGQLDTSGAPAGEDLSRLGAGYGLQFSERMQLDSATEMQARRAEAALARERAEQADAAARDKIDARDAAVERAEDAHSDAQAAESEAEQARRQALEAQKDADRYEDA